MNDSTITLIICICVIISPLVLFTLQDRRTPEQKAADQAAEEAKQAKWLAQVQAYAAKGLCPHGDRPNKCYSCLGLCSHGRSSGSCSVCNPDPCC